jgi:hypothetical protein
MPAKFWLAHLKRRYYLGDVASAWNIILLEKLTVPRLGKRFTAL